MFLSIARLELILAGRNQRFARFRRIAAGWLVLQFAWYYGVYVHSQWNHIWKFPPGKAPHTTAFASAFVHDYLATFVWQAWWLALLGVPGFVASTFTEEKTRGTIEHLLTADLTSLEIVVGKFLGKVVQLAVFLSCALPFAIFAGTLGNLEASSLFAICTFAIAPAIAICAVSLLASVLFRQNRDAILAVYLFVFWAWCVGELPILLVLFARYLPTTNFNAMAVFDQLNYAGAWMQMLTPIYILTPGWSHGHSSTTIQRMAFASVVWLVVTVASLALAAWRLRPVVRREMENLGKRRTPRPLPFLLNYRGLEADPIAWKEEFVAGVAPIGILRRVPTWAGWALTFMASVGVSFLLRYSSPLNELHFFEHAAMLASFTGLCVAIRASSAISGEREANTWEALLLTPLEIRQLIDSKLLGIQRGIRSYLVAYSIPVAALAALHGISCFLITAIGFVASLALIRLAGAFGVYFSATTGSSSRSLYGTLSWGYFFSLTSVVFGWPVLYGLLWIASFTLYQMMEAAVYYLHLGELGMIGRLAEQWGFTGTEWNYVVALASGFVLLVLIRHFVASLLFKAQRHVLVKERTPYYKAGENCFIATERFMEQWGSGKA